MITVSIRLERAGDAGTITRDLEMTAFDWERYAELCLAPDRARYIVRAATLRAIARQFEAVGAVTQETAP